MNALLEIRDLSVTYGRRGWRRMWGHTSGVQAVSGLDLTLGRGERLGIVGESGSGKSSMARAIVGLVPASGGSIRLDGTEIVGLSGRKLKPFRRNMQMVFQDPYSSLDPTMPVGRSVAEPLEVHLELSRAEVRQRVAELFELVGLSAQHVDRLPHEFSGGQRQRIAIARAISLNPSLVICDEPVSALDVSTQNQIMNLLEDLGEMFGIAFMFIAHDLSVVHHFADRVGVMYLGHLVELGTASEIFERPLHPYTHALLSAIPNPRPGASRERVVLKGELPDPADPPAGCPFNTRCPHVMDICLSARPSLDDSHSTHPVACHLYSDSGSVPVDAPSRGKTDQAIREGPENVAERVWIP